MASPWRLRGGSTVARTKKYTKGTRKHWRHRETLEGEGEDGKTYGAKDEQDGIENNYELVQA